MLQRLRTFGFICLLGALGGSLGTSFSLLIALLASGVALAWLLRITPLTAPWLLAKLLGLLLYIAFGLIAFRPGQPPAVRVAAWAGALVLYASIVSVAVTKNPFGYLQWL